MSCKIHELAQVSEHDFKCVNCPYSRSVIPKDCIVCDTCNKGVSDENFVATDNCYWYADWLYCSGCHANEQKIYPPRQAHELKMKILEKDDLSNTDLAKPIVMEFY